MSIIFDIRRSEMKIKFIAIFIFILGFSFLPIVSAKDSHDYLSNYSPGIQGLKHRGSINIGWHNPIDVLNDIDKQANPKVNTSNKWLLSLDGGGIRGLMQLYALAEVERSTGKPITDLFHGVSGTSIGGIIAILLTIPSEIDKTKPKYSAQYLLNYFQQNTKNFFKRRRVSLWGLLGPRYQTNSMKKLLLTLLGDNKLSDRIIPVVVVTHDYRTREERLFASNDLEDFYAKDIAMATGAAPTYFEAQDVFPINQSLAHRGYHVGDGGTCMNNPSFAGLALMAGVYKIKPEIINVLSLGTGNAHRIMHLNKLKKGGILTWGRHIADTCINGSASSINHMMQLFSRDKYYRFDPDIPESSMDMADTSQANLDVLFTAAKRLIEDKRIGFREIIARIDNNSRFPNTEDDQKPMYSHRNSLADSAIYSRQNTLSSLGTLRSTNYNFGSSTVV